MSTSTSLRLDIEHFAELFPVAAAPALELKLGPNHVVRCAGVHRDARHGGRKHKILQALRLLDDISPTEIVAALLKYLLEDQTLLVAGQIVGIPEIRPRQIFREEGAVAFHAGIIVPFRVGWILDEGPNDNAD